MLLLESMEFSEPSKAFQGICRKKSLPEELERLLASAHELIDAISVGRGFLKYRRR